MKIIGENGFEKDQESQLIKLEDGQATKVPYPPGCPVMVLENSRICYSGKVVSVFIAFDHRTGSCLNYYRISTSNATEFDKSEVVNGDKIRYAINCPIKISSKAGKINDEEAVEGIIKGFEIQDDEQNPNPTIPSFLYTVEVSAISSNNEEKVFRQRGITPDFIRYKAEKEQVFENSISASASSDEETRYVDTSVVSLDGGKNSAPNAFTSPRKLILSPMARNTGTFSPPTQMPSTPQTPHGREITKDFSSPQLINENEGNEKVFVKCCPLSKPHPTHFKGEFDREARIPDFSFLTNYPPGRANELPEGTKCCVMCGEIRGCNPGKSTKTKSMKSSEGYSQDTVVIPNQNKGLCTLCDVEVWVIKKNETEIKWCKGCKVRYVTQVYMYHSLMLSFRKAMFTFSYNHTHTHSQFHFHFYFLFNTELQGMVHIWREGKRDKMHVLP